MQGWLITNGFAEVDKVERLGVSLQSCARRLGYRLERVQTTDLLPYYDRRGRACLDTTRDLPPCDYILFWDKDTRLAAHLEQMGYRLFNSSAAIEACDDKLLTHQLLAGCDLPGPRTLLGPFAFYQVQVTREDYDRILALLGPDFILKEARGSFGMQVHCVSSFEAYRDLVASLGSRRFLLQENIQSSRGRDLRVMVVGDRIAGAMERRNDRDFRANMTLGGRGRQVELTAEQEALALAAHRALGLDFSGVDLLYGPEEEPLFCEVNSNVNYLSFEALSGQDIGSLLLAHIGERLSP